MFYSQEFIDNVIKDYKENPICIHQLADKYNISYNSVKRWLKKYNIQDNNYGRFSQPYILKEDYALIRIRKGNGFVYSLIDIEDVEKCKEIGIWSLTKSGYVMNCKTGIYLHRFVMNCPNDYEVDHIFHDVLDNRKSQLRIVTSSQQKMNTRIRRDNSSGHRGVYYDKSRNTWNVNINIVSSKKYARKRFKTYEEACKYADDFYKENFGEYKYKVKS